MANYVLSEELRRLVVQVCNQHMSSFQPRPKRGRRPRQGGGVSFGDQPPSQFAVVTYPAGPSTKTANSLGIGGDIGECVLRSTYYFQPTAPQEDPPPQEFRIEFRSLHSVPIPVGSLIKLHCDRDIPIPCKWPATLDNWRSGQDAEGKHVRAVWGEYFRSVDELFQLQNAGPKKILWLPEQGTDGEFIRWDAGEC